MESDGSLVLIKLGRGLFLETKHSLFSSDSTTIEPLPKKNK